LLEIIDSFICFRYYYSFTTRVITTIISSYGEEETSELLDSNRNNLLGAVARFLFLAYNLRRSVRIYSEGKASLRSAHRSPRGARSREM